MQSIVLVILIVIDDYLDKIVLNPGKRTYIKRKDVLLGWLIAAVMRYLDLELGLVADIILN